MRKLLIACLNLLLVFNSIGFQAINATEVDPPNEGTYEPSLPTEETNSDDSIKETTDTIVSTEEEKEETNINNAENDNLSNITDGENNSDTDLSAEEDINTINDSINEDNTLEINDSVKDEQISTEANETIEFLNIENFKNNLPDELTNLYFGKQSDYDLSRCDSVNNIGNNYKLYKNSYYGYAYVICKDENQIFFPEDSSNLFNGFYSLKQITFKNVNTSHVKTMNKMFNYCKKLTTLDLSSFNTDNVTNM